MRKLAAIAKRYIQPSTNQRQTFYTDADVKDIISVIIHADGRSKDFTHRFAPFLRGSSDYQTLKNIWSFMRRYIRYEKDAAGDEVIKSPGRTWADKYGDCKSMSVMVGSLLKNLGFRYFYRVAFYDPDNPEQGHIYPVVILPGGQHVIVDAVHHTFDEEVPYWQADNYDATTGKKEENVAAVSGPPSMGWLGIAFAIAVGVAAYQNSNQHDQSKLHTRCS